MQTNKQIAEQKTNKKTKINENIYVYGYIQIDICGLGKKATINAPELRTVNRKAEAGSKSGIIIVIIINLNHH